MWGAYPVDSGLVRGGTFGNCFSEEVEAVLLLEVKIGSTNNLDDRKPKKIQHSYAMGVLEETTKTEENSDESLIESSDTLSEN